MKKSAKTKALSEKEWQTLWNSSRYSGATRLVLENLAKRIGITLEDLKQRIETKTDKEWQREFRENT